MASYTQREGNMAQELAHGAHSPARHGHAAMVGLCLVHRQYFYKKMLRILLIIFPRIRHGRCEKCLQKTRSFFMRMFQKILCIFYGLATDHLGNEVGLLGGDARCVEVSFHTKESDLLRLFGHWGLRSWCCRCT